MRMFRRGGAIALSVLVVSAFLVSPASADTEVVRPGPRASSPPPTPGPSTSSCWASRSAPGRPASRSPAPPGQGHRRRLLLLAPGTVSTLATTGPDQKEAPPKACVLNIDPPLLSLLGLQTACGEARVDSTAGAPQAYGKGEVARPPRSAAPSCWRSCSPSSTPWFPSSTRPSAPSPA